MVTGVPLPGFSRFCVGAKSPLTGGYGESEAGGHWAAELKFAGYDAIIIQGKLPHPVYLWVSNGTAQLKDARHLWGLTTDEIEARILEEVGDSRAKVAYIGPAGEAGVRFACIMHGARNAACGPTPSCACWPTTYCGTCAQPFGRSWTTPRKSSACRCFWTNSTRYTATLSGWPARPSPS